MNALKNKLTSQSGASITYALLLFLVCAVVSSVVLAAGTAASGRISKSAESDQRYFSVTSAAKLFKEMIDGKSVKVVNQTVTQTVTNSEGTSTPDGYPRVDNSENDCSIVTEAATYLANIKTAPSSVSRTITLNISGQDDLTTYTQETLDPTTGRITLVVSNKNLSGSDKSDVYSITLIFDPEIKESSSSRTVGKGTSRTKTVTTTTEMTWHMISMG